MVGVLSQPSVWGDGAVGDGGEDGVEGGGSGLGGVYVEHQDDVLGGDTYVFVVVVYLLLL